MNGPFGIKVEMWGLAKDWGLNLDELDPDRDRLYGRDYGDDSAKTCFEKDMVRTGVTVEDLKEVDRGEHGNPFDNFKDVHPPLDPSLYVCAFPMPEDFDPQKIIESLGDLDDDDDDDEDDQTPIKEEAVFTPCKRTNDGEYKNLDDDDDEPIGADKQMDDEKDDVLLCLPSVSDSNKRLCPLDGRSPSPAR